MNMKNKIFLLVPILIVVFANVANADVLYSQTIQLSPGWNIISTPKILESHSFSVSETSDNFDIYALDPSKTSGWATLADLGQTEFTPLHGYFINNKTGINQTLTFNYKGDTTPNQRLFERTFPTTGWYSFGIANPTYAKTTSSNNTDTNNPDFLLNSLLGAQSLYSTVIDFTDAKYSQDINSVALSNPWSSRIRSISPSDNTEINKLNDFRETKGYAIYIREANALYNGFQNTTVTNMPACSDGIDNDGDNLADMNDPGCISLSDNNEADDPNATLQLSLNSSSPTKKDVVASQGANENELDKLTTLVFDVKAEKDDVTIKDMRIGVIKSGNGTAVAQTTYLYDGSTEIGSASMSGGMASFNDLDYVVPQDTTKTLAIKIEIRNANGSVANFITQASTTISEDLLSENTLGGSVTESGSAVGYQIGVRNVGPEFTLVSKSITTSGVPQANGINDLSTSTLTATFNVKVKAVGGDIVFGTNQATSSPFVASTTSFMVYRGDSPDSSISSYATSTSITFPSTCVTSGLTNSCRLAEGSEVTVPVSFQIQGRSGTGALTSGLYSIGIAQLNWQNVIIGAQTSTFMAGETDWRTADVSFP